MVEDGWDRLAASFSGFHGGVMLMARRVRRGRHGHWGHGNWEPYPIADFLFHDKVLMYQHDLYEQTMTADPEMLTFNLAFGFVLSYAWAAATRCEPVARARRRVPTHARAALRGATLTRYRDVADDVTETCFGRLLGGGQLDGVAVEVDGRGSRRTGFLAQATDGSVLAATLGPSWSPASHFSAGARLGLSSTPE